MSGLQGRDFLRVADWSGDELTELLDLADRLKAEHRDYVEHQLLPGRALGLVFDKPSLRTRVSFEVAIAQLGGYPVHLGGEEVGFGQRESVREMGIVLSRYLDAIVVRTSSEVLVDELAASAAIPVVNGLTDSSHPLQALADAMTIRERLGTFEDTSRRTKQSGLRARQAARPSLSATRARRCAARRPSAPTSGRAWARSRSASAGCATSTATRSMPRWSRPRPTRSCSTVCLRTSVRRLPRTSSTGPQSAAWDEAANRLHTEKALLALIVE